MFYLHVDTSVIWRSAERAAAPSRDVLKHGAHSHAQRTLIKKIFQIRCFAWNIQEYSHVLFSLLRCLALFYGSSTSHSDDVACRPCTRAHVLQTAANAEKKMLQ